MNIAIRIWIVILSFACITPVYANDQSGKIYYIDNLGGSCLLYTSDAADE